LNKRSLPAVICGCCEGVGNCPPLRPRAIAVSKVEGDIDTMIKCLLIVVIAVWGHTQVEHNREVKINHHHSSHNVCNGVIYIGIVDMSYLSTRTSRKASNRMFEVTYLRDVIILLFEVFESIIIILLSICLFILTK